MTESFGLSNFNHPDQRKSGSVGRALPECEVKIADDDYLWITGRVKYIFKTSKGKYVSPVKIEIELEPRANLEQICVMGSNMTQPIVIGVVSSKPNKPELTSFEARLERIMDEVNAHLDKP